MSHKSPNHVQVALLYDNVDRLDLRKMMSTFLATEEQGFGHKYNVIEFDEKAFFRCFGGRDIMVFVEKIDRPANRACFEAALGSVFNNLAQPDAAALIDRHRTHLLINVHNGPMPPDPQIQAMLAQLNMPEAGQSLPEYRERLRALGMLTTIATQSHAPLLSHWTHSEMLVEPAKLGETMLDDHPSLLHIHPLPYRGPGTTQEEGVAGLVTHGASFFIGREIRVRPNTVPWMENFESALAFVRMAIAEKGYVVPDGDTFSDEAETVCYRVHHEAEPFLNAGREIPCYELELLRNTKHGFVAPDYISSEYTVDLDAPGTADPADPRNTSFALEWRKRRQMAEQAGAGFQVKVDMTANGPAGGRFFGRRANNEGAASGGALGWLKRRILN